MPTDNPVAMEKPPPISDDILLTFDRPPQNRLPLLRALCAGRPAQAGETQRQLRFHAQWNGVVTDPRALARYTAVCDLPSSDTLPILYPHILAMPLHMAVLSHPRFPLRLMGLVHLSNHIEMLRAPRNNEVTDLQCLVGPIQLTDRGQTFQLQTQISVHGEPIWREDSTILAPLHGRCSSGTATHDSSTAPDWGAPLAQWQLGADAGRRFAGPSGDWNPIHLSAPTARLFGFSRAIAHGMYSAARCLCVLAPQLQSPAGTITLDLRFKRPLLIPACVQLHARQQGISQHFLLRNSHTAEPHIEGLWTNTAK
jgi:hypothetical protein